MESVLNPGLYARRLFFLNGGCVNDASGSVDRAYVERMRNLVDGLRPGVKLLLLAFERAHDEQGRPNLDGTSFYVPDATHGTSRARIRSTSNGRRRSIRTGPTRSRRSRKRKPTARAP